MTYASFLVENAKIAYFGVGGCVGVGTVLKGDHDVYMRSMNELKLTRDGNTKGQLWATGGRGGV
jgi:hypothetical protein